jgi:hypothetical protein
MFGGLSQPVTHKSAALVVALTLLALGAMAASIPEARLTPKVTGVERGYLVGLGSFSDMLVDTLNRDGYNYLAIDFTRASLGGTAIWRDEFDRVARIFPVWGWVDVRPGVEQARRVAASLPLQGLFLYGARAEDVEAVRQANPGLRLLPVVRPGASAGKERCAVALPPERFAAEAQGPHVPVLLADSLDEARISEARAKATGDYLVSAITILD